MHHSALKSKHDKGPTNLACLIVALRRPKDEPLAKTLGRIQMNAIPKGLFLHRSIRAGVIHSEGFRVDPHWNQRIGPYETVSQDGGCFGPSWLPANLME